MIVYVVVGEYESSLMSEVFGAFDSREKAIDYVRNNFINVEHDADHDNIGLRIVKLEVQ